MLREIFSKIENILLENLLKSFLILYIVSMLSVGVLWILTKSDSGIRMFGNIDGGEAGVVGEGGIEQEKDKIQVAISGAVKNPGVYELTSEQRLIHLINLAGGFISDASEEWITKNVNLSSKLEDTQKIYIPFKWDTESTKLKNRETDLYALVKPIASTSAVESVDARVSGSGSQTGSGQADAGTSVDVNTASQEDVDSLPGIGPVYAARIIENRPYDDLEGFEETSGLPSNVIENIKNLISF